MRTNTFFLLILLLVFFITAPAPAQQEEITLSTYYPAPFGEYDELCAEKLLVDTPSAAELQDMQEGDCHITGSMIVGSGAGTGFSYDELEGVGSLPDNGDLLIRGYVGIGTPEPNTTLDLDGAFSIRGIPTASAPLVAPVDEGRIYFDSDTDTFRVSVNGGAYDDLVTGAGGAFWAETATGNHIYNTNITGNVGIGTNDPSGSHKLKVVGPTKIEGKLALLSSAYSVSSLQPGIVFGHCFGIQKANYCSGIHRLGPFPTGSYTVFSSGMSDVMTLTDTGSVGIGTTSPTSRLHINPTVTLTGDYTGLNSGIVYNGVSAMTNWYGAKVSAPTGTGTIANKYALVTEANAGNVGIGTTNPLKPFQVRPAVDKNFGVRNGVNVASAVAIEAVNDADSANIPLEIRASIIYQFASIIHSDARLKKNIRKVDGALGKVMHLNGVTWQWKDEKREQAEQMGVVAQDVEKVAPQLVREGDDGMKYLNYDGLNALTIEAIKELKAGNDSLKAQNMQLEARIKRLEAQLR